MTYALFFDAPVGPCYSMSRAVPTGRGVKADGLVSPKNSEKNSENSANTFPFNIFQPSQILKNNPNKNIPSSKHPISNFQFPNPPTNFQPWPRPGVDVLKSTAASAASRQRVRRAGSEGRRFRGARWGFLRKIIYLRRIKEIYRYDCHWFSILWKSDVVWYITWFAG